MLRLLRNVAVLVVLSLPAARAVAQDFVQNVASADRHWQPKGAHLTLGDALRIADAEFDRRLHGASQKKALWFYYGCDKTRKCTWEFTYASVVETMTIRVNVDDRTERAEFEPFTGEEIWDRAK